MKAVIAYEVRLSSGTLDVFEFICQDLGDMVMAVPYDNPDFIILCPNDNEMAFDVSATKYIKSQVQDHKARVKCLGIFQDQFLIDPLI